jgi:hypothetical protein
MELAKETANDRAASGWTGAEGLDGGHQDILRKILLNNSPNFPFDADESGDALGKPGTAQTAGLKTTGGR